MVFLRQSLAVLFVACCLLLIFISPSAHAQTMSNDNYTIQTQDVNTVTNVSASIDKPEANADPSVSEGVNFKIKKGFQDAPLNSPFNIDLSSDIASFGTISPTNPIIRTVDLNVGASPANGYSVIIYENQPLSMISASSKIIIPDTTCDNGGCSAENAAEWTNALTYGFGYRCDNLVGLDCDSSFAKANFYKHFPNIDSNDDPQPIMAGIGSDSKQVRISYNINTSGNQAQGLYTNVITYIAVPNF